MVATSIVKSIINGAVSLYCKISPSDQVMSCLLTSNGEAWPNEFCGPVITVPCVLRWLLSLRLMTSSLSLPGNGH